MSIRTHINSIGAALFMLAIITGCGGGGDMNFNVGSGVVSLGDWPNWPWPWQADANFIVSKTYSESITDSGFTNLVLDGINGLVTITGVPGGDSVSVFAKARVGSTTLADAQAGLNLLELVLTENGSSITIQTSQPANFLDRQYIVDYNITVPSDLPVNVYLENGHVTVNNLENTTFVVLGNGNVEYNNVSGASTVSIDTGTFNGTISLNPGSETLISTGNGDIDLAIPATTSAELFLQVGNGTISRENLDLVNVQSTSNTLQGVLNGGAGLIDLETVNGNISIAGI